MGSVCVVKLHFVIRAIVPNCSDFAIEQDNICFFYVPLPKIAYMSFFVKDELYRLFILKEIFYIYGYCYNINTI